MKFLLLVFILSGANASYRVEEFPGYCAGENGCEFGTREKCEAFLSENHKHKPLTDCLDVTLEVSDREAAVLAEKTEREQIRGFIQAIKNYNPTCVDKDGNEVKLQPAWLKRKRIYEVKNMR